MLGGGCGYCLGRQAQGDRGVRDAAGGAGERAAGGVAGAEGQRGSGVHVLRYAAMLNAATLGLADAL